MSLKNTFAAFALVAIAAVSFSSVSAEAGDHYKKKVVVVDSSGRKMKVKEKGYYDVHGWKHVQTLKVKVKGTNGKLKLKTNGMDFYPTYVSGPTPYYAFALNQAIRGFELYNDGDLDCLIDGIELDAYDHLINSALSGSFYGAIPTLEIREIQEAVQALAYYVTLEENQEFLLPIKILAGRALATTWGRGEYSMKTSEAILALIAQIDFSREFLEERMSVEATYTPTVLLLSHQARLADMLD